MDTVITSAAVSLIKREEPRLVAATGLIFQALLTQGSPTERSIDQVLLSQRGGIWGDEVTDADGTPVLRSTNMRGPKVDVTSPAWIRLSEKEIDKCRLQTGDILVTKSSGSSDLVGKASLFVHPGDDKDYLFSNFVLRLRPDESKVMPEYLAWFLRSPQSLAWRFASQQNAVGLRNLQTKQFLNQQIPVPDSRGQQSVVEYLNQLEANNYPNQELDIKELAGIGSTVTKIEFLTTRINETKQLRKNIHADMDSLLVAMAHRNDLSDEEKTKQGWERAALGEVLTQVSDPVPVEPGCEYPHFGIYSFAKGLFQKAPLLGDEIKATKLYRVHEGQFIYGRLNAYEGAFAVVGPDFNGGHVSNEFPAFECDRHRVLPEFLRAHFSTPAVWEKLKRSVTGIGGGAGNRRIRLKEATLLSAEIWLPPIDQQHKIALTAERLTSVRRSRGAAGLKLDALLPSILDQAFKGEL
ncbi:MAG: restriction endonuclease subunit S [Candidatus Thiodiazotropha taylori]|nr:restriction endonuclease subunit S [Candidatus Thiodiazotropha taylori]